MRPDCLRHQNVVLVDPRSETRDLGSLLRIDRVNPSSLIGHPDRAECQAPISEGEQLDEPQEKNTRSLIINYFIILHRPSHHFFPSLYDTHD